MNFCYFVIISPWKRTRPFNWTNLNPFYLRVFCAKLSFQLWWAKNLFELISNNQVKSRERWRTSFWILQRPELWHAYSESILLIYETWTCTYYTYFFLYFLGVGRNWVVFYLGHLDYFLNKWHHAFILS